MPAIHRLRLREAQGGDETSPVIQKLLLVLLVLTLSSLFLVGILLLLRFQRRAKARQAEADAEAAQMSISSNHKRLTITATDGKQRQSMLVYQEKQALMAESPNTSPSEVPEIHITFPEETDDAGKRKSGRVVVVSMGDGSVGMGPVADAPPSYYESGPGRFQSLDLDRIGGLKESR